jgi:hypothetical protein
LIIRITDFNGANAVITNSYQAEWQELQRVLEQMPLHLKAPDQAGRQGARIFDAVGTNCYIKNALTNPALNWGANIRIPAEYNFLGTDVDFCKSGLLVEAQFSNYPFLLNNMLRSELFFKARTQLNGHVVGAVVIITKAHMFPASNSTLYYEQAVNQLTSLAKNHVFDIPMRLVGLFERTNAPARVKVTEYVNPRYSREVVAQLDYDCTLTPSRGRGRCMLTVREIQNVQPE